MINKVETPFLKKFQSEFNLTQGKDDFLRWFRWFDNCIERFYEHKKYSKEWIKPPKTLSNAAYTMVGYHLKMPYRLSFTADISSITNKAILEILYSPKEK